MQLGEFGAEGPDWCSFVQIGACLGRLVQVALRLVEVGVIWCNLVQVSAVGCSLAQAFALLYWLVQFDVICCRLV